MTSLMITDIRKSGCDRVFDLITAVFLSSDGYDASVLRSLGKRSLLVLESATAREEIPAIGVRRGDQYIRVRAKPDHGLSVGEVIRFERQDDLRSRISIDDLWPE
jgi:hypothetical protein